MYLEIQCKKYTFIPTYIKRQVLIKDNSVNVHAHMRGAIAVVF